MEILALLFPELDQMDPAGPFEVLSRLPALASSFREKSFPRFAIRSVCCSLRRLCAPCPGISGCFPGPRRLRPVATDGR